MLNNILPVLLALVGSYFLIKLRFFFVLHPIRTASRTLRAVKDKRVLRSFCLALAGTLGVGNVFGVALGILIGGAGSLFWLLASMIFAMVIKYAEVVISSDNLYHDTDTHGGFFYVIRLSFKRLGSLLSHSYALATLLLSLFLGASLQTDAVRESVYEIIDFPRHYLAIILVLITFVSIVGGAKRIEKISVIIIPLTTIIYISLMFGIVVANIDRLGEVIEGILRSAFTLKGMVGGGVGFLMSEPIREGFARGMLSNEAGAGTSAMAHARSGVISPSTAGLFGIFEVWFDTGLVCMLTGLSILLSVPDYSCFDGGMQLVMYSVGNLFGAAGKYAVLLCVFAFAYATVICWYYYGSESFAQLFGKKRKAVFLPLFLIFVAYGCYANVYTLVSVTDALMTVATLLTLSALIKNSDRIRHLSESGGVVDSERGRVRRFRIIKSEFLKGEQHR